MADNIFSKFKKGVSKVASDYKNQYEKHENLLPVEIDSKDFEKEIRSLQAEIQRALSPDDLNKLPAAISNTSMINSIIFQIKEKRINKNVAVSTDQINAIRDYTDALKQLQTSRIDLAKEQLRSQVALMIAKLEFEIEYHEKVNKLESVKNNNEEESKKIRAKSRLVLAAYRSQLSDKDTLLIEKAIEEGASPDDIEDTCNKLVKRKKESQQSSYHEKKDPQKSFIDDFIEEVKSLPEAETKLKKLFGEEGGERMYRLLVDEWRRRRLDEQL